MGKLFVVRINDLEGLEAGVVALASWGSYREGGTGESKDGREFHAG